MVRQVSPLLVYKKATFVFQNFEMQSDSHKDVLIRFGVHLQSLRQKKNLSLRKLALNCNLDHSMIKKYENGDYNLSLISLTELAAGLEIPLKELMDF